MNDAVSLDVDYVRSHFPGLDNEWAFFENAGGSMAPRAVSDRLNAYVTETHVQPGAGFPSSTDR